MDSVSLSLSLSFKPFLQKLECNTSGGYPSPSSKREELVKSKDLG